MPLSGSSYGGRSRGLKSPDPGRFERKPPKANLTEGFAHPKPARPERKPAKGLQSNGSIQRHTRMKQRRGTRRGDPNPAPQAFAKPAGRAYDTPYMLEVKKLPCVLLRFDPSHVCDGKSEADHAGTRARGRKCDDRKTIPFCPCGHKHRARFRGYFKAFDKARMRVWLDERIAETQATLSWVPVAVQEAA